MSSHDLKMDFFEIGDKTSLICANPDASETICATLKELGFKIHTVSTVEAGIERLRHIQYDCVVIQEDFAGSALRTNGVLSYLAPLPMAQRRYSFTCLIGESFTTMDAMQGFVESVHMVIHPGDLPSLSAILKKGLAVFEERYRVYKEVFAANA